MKFEVHVDGVERKLDVEIIAGGKLHVRFADKHVDADAAQISPGEFSILIAGHSFAARVLPGKDNHSLLVRCGGREFAVELRDPRAWRGARGGVLATEGRQQVSAPMPGKVVRVLVAAGEIVEAGQGLVVVEAMKMQNEVRAPKKGKVERVFVSEGQAVSSGEPLVMIG